MNLGRVRSYSFQMATRIVAVSFAGLGHQIRYENLYGPSFADRLRHACHQQIRQDAGVKRSRTDCYDIGRANRGERFRKRQALLGLESKMPDRSARGADLSLAANFTPVVEFGNQTHICNGSRINMALAGQDFGRQANRLDEIAGDVGQRCQEQVAKAMTAEPT